MCEIVKPLFITSAVIATALVALCAWPMPARAAAPTADVKAVGQAANQFAFDIYQKLASDPGNIIFSPYSIDTALGMLDVGARGDTHTELAAAMHQPQLDPAAFQAAMGQLIQQFQASKAAGSAAPVKGYELHVADALWGQKGVTWLPAYLDAMKTNFAAGLESLDFSNEPVARKTINDWVSAQTADRIKDLIPSGAIKDNTRMVLTNAVYFKADWQTKFKSSKTHDGDFHADGKTAVIQAPLMNQTANFDYMDNDQLQAVRMPYVGDDVAMIVLLPKSTGGLPAVEKALDAKLLDGVTAAFKSQQVNITLPKFKANQTLPLNGTLAALGIKKAFTNQADFSGMTGSRDLYLSSAIHKAFIAVDEDGTEAAAATGLMVAGMAMRVPPPAIEFKADHPFLLLLTDTKTGVVLFIGRVENPTTPA
jgi:serpin B